MAYRLFYYGVDEVVFQGFKVVEFLWTYLNGKFKELNFLFF